MPDREDSKRPQERDFTIDQWEKYPFTRKEDPYENRPDEKAPDPPQNQYEYEGWEKHAFPNRDVSEKPAEPGETDPAPSSSKEPAGKNK